MPEFGRISSAHGAMFIERYHYARGCHNGPMCYGMHIGGDLVGVCAFATPASENVRASIFGPDELHRVTELHRLVLLDKAPKFSESRLISASLKMLLEDRQDLRAVISFANPGRGHLGTIYQATNAIYCGLTKPTRMYVDQSGRKRHPRQNGVNISIGEAHERGWSVIKDPPKHRYVFMLGTKRMKRHWRRRLLLREMPYPKALR